MRRVVVDRSVEVAERVATTVGGAAAWACVAAAAAGAAVRCVAAVGTDRAGVLCRQHLARADVDVTGVLPLEGATTRLIRRSAAGAAEVGSTGALSEDPADSSLLILPGAGWPTQGLQTERVLGRCEPGDVLLIEWSALPDADGLVRAAYERDMQIMVLLAPYPVSPFPIDLRLVDVAVVDRAGAALLADAGELPGSLCVTLPGYGLSWDGQTSVAPVAKGLSTAAVVTDERGHAVLAGTIAGRLACGDDRPQAAQGALSAAGQLVVTSDDPGMTGAVSASAEPGSAAWLNLRPWAHLRLDVEELG
ncbi:hypothetical protein AUCHE_08_02860 [Austwickia chelonae NBRC 105200]|uniref:Carbohydrate kinase PfkB domain-containing protein n=1 Tax=Austwickia chelonae NBRC 105200 TaxID=1184607 RepID=K6W8A5_9MICO|nr:hypothetical protein AUCHE_08_02860 [Austwickia chelonae NBRC 105200]